MQAKAMRERLAAARVAHLATVGAEGKPHLVPITFAVEGDVIYFTVDAKPKRTTHLQRL
ncbi:MAG TPA: pyridoxamine 5'-phosphate oxidase family protein, partial [Candidatus Dormibacteraeota bacterium]|nr:pyridoxamine 5'-phosphate oxidase family protein [Candidatus Dormibacteraeota bacterium]